MLRAGYRASIGARRSERNKHLKSHHSLEETVDLCLVFAMFTSWILLCLKHSYLQSWTPQQWQKGHDKQHKLCRGVLECSAAPDTENEL